MSLTKAVLFTKDNQNVEIEFSTNIYKRAEESKCSVPQMLEREFGQHVDREKHGSVFNQMLAQCNMSLNGDKYTGLASANFGKVMDGSISASITKDSGIPLSRVLAPAALLEAVELNRLQDTDSYEAAFSRQVAIENSVVGTRFERPYFDMGNADKQESSVIAQLSYPTMIGKLTTSQIQGSIPTTAFGLEISKEALQSMTMAQITSYLARMQKSAAAGRIDQHINSLVAGDIDAGKLALTSTKSKVFDTSLATTGGITQRAYLKWLLASRATRAVDYVWCDLETYLQVADRPGRPTANSVNVPDSESQHYLMKPVNFEYNEPAFFIVNDGSIPTGTLVGLDSRAAIERFRNTLAPYEAALDLVMQRGTAMRFDEGEAVQRHDDNAWTVLDLSA